MATATTQPKLPVEFLRTVLAPLVKAIETAGLDHNEYGIAAAYVKATGMLKPLVLRKLASKFYEMFLDDNSDEEKRAKVGAALYQQMKDQEKETLVVRIGDHVGVITTDSVGEKAMVIESELIESD